MIEIVPAAPAEYEPALALLFNRLAAAEQKASMGDVLRALGRGRISVHGLLTSHADGILVGSILYMLQQDRTAFVWPPSSLGENARAVDDALLSETIRRIELADAWIGQCLIHLNWRQERETLERNGFKHLTNLRFLVCRLDHVPKTLPLIAGRANAPLETIAYQPGVNDARFARVIEQTYVKTRDCPELEGSRTGEQALASHRMSGEFDPARWKLFRWQGRDAGVLLMNDHPEQSSWEVVYLGVVHDCRGNSLGERMLAQGLLAARAAGRSAVLLAVDCRNEYAAKVYDDLGFVETDRRAVHLHLPARPAVASESQ